MRNPTEAELHDAGARFRRFFESAPIGAAIVATDGRFCDVNDSFCELVGYRQGELVGKSFDELTHPDDLESVAGDAAHVLESGEPSRRECRYIARDGRVVWVQVETHRASSADGEQLVQRFVFDISAQKRAEEERDRLRRRLEQTQRLESIGRLAGGIAHDFNNMLTAIKGYSAQLVDELPPSTQAHHAASQIARAAEQAASLPAQLLAFSRGQALELQLLDLRTVVAGAGELLGTLLGEAVELVIVLVPEPAFALVDHGQVEQVLVNLALNARDAMPNGGTLTVTMTTAAVGADLAAEHAVPSGSYRVISVADDGEGMDIEIRTRAFEPFFTTKPHAEGFGLGLASVDGTVTQSGGFVRLESRPGSGTVVHLYFPAAAPPAARELTNRERQVLALVSEGKTNQVVAAELGISIQTVQTHLRNAMGKLDADARAQVAATLRQSLLG